MPICTTCSETHEVTFFNRDRSRPSGHDPRCKKCTRAACKRVFEKNREQHLALKLRWKRENPERRSELGREWRAKNPDRVRQNTANYRARLKRATPPWVPPEAIAEVRAKCPDGYHVDHIVPLAGASVSGLNVPWNLQYLPPDEHWRKGNRLIEAEGVCYL